MKKIFFLLFILCSIHSYGQTNIIVKNEDGLLMIPGKANGFQTCFIYNEEEAQNLITQKQAMYMFRSGLLQKSDIVGAFTFDPENDENLAEGVVLKVKDFYFGGLNLVNAKFSIVKDMDAPFLVCKSTIENIGSTQFNAKTNTLTIESGKSNFDFSKLKMNFELPKESVLSKDAPVNVTVTDFKNNPLPNEIMIFKSRKNQNEYQGLTNDKGQFSIRLPSGDVYQIFILGFKDSTSIDSLVIAGLSPLEKTKVYDKPQVVTYQFLPAKSFILEDCNFDNGKATLQEGSYQVLDELVAYLVRKDDEKIELGGHTDNVGSAASNLKLSQDRANTVRDYLISKGIDSARLQTKGYGMTMPIESNNTAAGRAVNRRTEVKILE